MTPDVRYCFEDEDTDHVARNSLAGQPAEYLLIQLRLWRSGVRGRTAGAEIMARLADGLRPEEMEAVAAYFASLPPGAPVPADQAVRQARRVARHVSWRRGPAGRGQTLGTQFGAQAHAVDPGRERRLLERTPADPIRRVIGSERYRARAGQCPGPARRPELASGPHAAADRAAPRLPRGGFGETVLVKTDQPAVLAHLCRWKGHAILALHNLAADPCTVRIDPAALEGRQLAALAGDQVYQAPEQSGR